MAPSDTCTRLIACNESNAGDFRALVKTWPELHALIGTLQAQDLFPGLRGLSLRLTGPSEWVGQGVAAAIAQTAPAAPHAH